MNIACSTCLESFTSGCDISTTPCGHVFHTGCITRWLNGNNNCSQCRKGCEIGQIIKLYFSESQSAIEEQITINDLEQQSLQMDEENQEYIQEVNTLKKLVLDKSIEIGQLNQKCANLEHEKLLMKLDWSKTEWNLKESTIEAYIRIEDLEKEVEEQKMMELNFKHTINRLTKRIKDLEKEVDDQKWLWLDSNTEPAELEVKRQTNSGLESKAGETEGASPAQKRNHKDCPTEILADKENIGKISQSMISNKNDALDIFVATLDRLRIGIKSSSVLYIYCKDLWEYLNILSSPQYYAIYALNCDKLENWLTLLKNMDGEQLTDKQVSEMEIDFKDALKKLSINNVLEVTK